MKRIFLTAAMAAFFMGSLWAQEPAGAPEGGISAELLEEISKGYEHDADDRAIRNALAGTSIATLAINAENAAMIDTHFSDRVRTKGITDQKSSGRCWLFTGLNVLRAKMIDKYELPGMEFSQNYIFFYDQLEKANLFLQGVIDTKELPFEDRKVDWLFSNPLSDGGQFTGVSNLIVKYGVVPAEAMPETFQSDNTSQMATLLKLKLREDGLVLRDAAASGASAKKLQKMKVEQLSEIYRMLALCLGEPVKEFEWTRCDKDNNIVSRKTYTPKSFYHRMMQCKVLQTTIEHNITVQLQDYNRTPLRNPLPFCQVYELKHSQIRNQ